LQDQQAYLKKSFALLSLQALRFHHDTQQLIIINSLQEYLWNKITLPQDDVAVEQTPEQATSLVSTSTQIPNVDMEKVRSAWLQRHNQERALL
jgi:hypothetical protein